MPSVDSDYYSAPVERCRECRVELTAIDDDCDDLCVECAEEANVAEEVRAQVREDIAA
jgi:hypothetical protein